MRKTSIQAVFRTAILGGGAILLAATASTAHAADVDVSLKAVKFTVNLDGAPNTSMWGFVLCDEMFANCGTAAAPGPQINLVEGDDLHLHVSNEIEAPISIVVPGLQTTPASAPVYGADGRVRSFTAEADAPAPFGGLDSFQGPTSITYDYLDVKAGTYLYQSGTWPSIEVPMGLFGAFVVKPAASPDCVAPEVTAYNVAGTDVCVDTDVVVVFSEIDPWLNNGVEGADGVTAEFPSTVDYQASYYLVNGQVAADLPAVAQDDNVLVRFLNAGLESHIPAFHGYELTLVAEDGFPYSGALRRQASTLVPAGKTLDVLLDTPLADATLAMFDRMPAGSNDNQMGGGVAHIDVGAGGPTAAARSALDDFFVIDEETSFFGDVSTNDLAPANAGPYLLVTAPAHGSVSLLGNGTFTYSGGANFTGIDSFVYSANGEIATAELTVLSINDAPVANADGPYTNMKGLTVTVDAKSGVLGNDIDADGDVLTATVFTPPASGSVALAANGSFVYTGGTPGSTVTFTYRVTDGTVLSAPATVTINVLPVANIALTVLETGTATAVTDYRWLVQEDVSFQDDPDFAPDFPNVQSTSFHKSYYPVVASGHNAAEFAQVALDPAKIYYVSVLPDDAGNEAADGHEMSGTMIPQGATALTLNVNPHPTPTAQLAILAFEDIAPTNGVWDPGEPGLPGFTVILEDAGGRYGISGGPLYTDTFGEPLTNSLDCFGASPPPAGVILTCPAGSPDAGKALVKGVAPAKYGLVVNPPASANGKWIQTSTIEGTRVIDAWVMPNEPPYMVEFGVTGYHGMFGFVNPETRVVPVDAGPAIHDITGAITLLHDNRPPVPPGLTSSGSFAGLAYTRAWVGLNSVAGDGPNWATVHAETDGTFTLPNIPDGTYQVVVFDDFLDIIIGFYTATVAGGDLDMGELPVNAWFTRQEHYVFLDLNQNGIWEEADGEIGLPNQNVNIRWRDGTVNLAAPTDGEGFVPFDEIFPFFSWQVAEVDFARFKPTGVTVTVDKGGTVDTGGRFAYLLNSGGGTQERTETGPVLLEAFQGFAGQTNVFDWGKAPYAPGENGGISGIVFYGATRGENDPRLTVGDPWEGGIPNVKVRLYREVLTAVGETSLALVEEVETDSWDDSQPEGCTGEDPGSVFVTTTLGGVANVERCYDGMRNWNQTRPGVFDGGYAFADLAPGTYVVEVVLPPGFELYTEVDKNVDFGNPYEVPPVAMLLPGGAAVMALPDLATVDSFKAGYVQPPCVGELHYIEPDAELSLFPGIEAPFRDQWRPLCDRKEVVLADQSQAAADFHLFTSTPIAAQVTGLSLDDLGNETIPASPNFGEKFAPANLPISFRDHRGNEVYRTHSDGYGRYDGLFASTFTASIPMPSGYSPAMYDVCLNDPGDGIVPDPLVVPGYSRVCYPLQFMPRATTYADTPILPNAAFNAGYNPPDCAQPSGVPAITAAIGPITGGAFADVGQTVTITANELTEIANPAYAGPNGNPYKPPTIWRDTSFGPGGLTQGTVRIGATFLTITSWTPTSITATIPAGAVTGDLIVRRGDNFKESPIGVTFTVKNGAPDPIVVATGGSIQAAIDAADPGELIIVQPGRYREQIVMYKPVRLQGAGPATMIDAEPTAIDAFAVNAKIQDLLDAGTVDLLPNQPAAIDVIGGGALADELGAVVMVLAKNDGSFVANPARIDGFTLTGAPTGGGVYVNAWAHNLRISNNVVTNNSGNITGGIRIGSPLLVTAAEGDGPFAYNTGVTIENNMVIRNGAVSELAAGGGIALTNGSDNYRVVDNFVCGNFTQGDGAGIGHYGFSDNGLIQGNVVLFNQSYNLSFTRSGGGIFVSGEAQSPPAVSLGAGNVTINANRIQGNHAAAGHGAGIRAERVNGRDVELDMADEVEDRASWNKLVITNNIIVNNVAGWSGGGVSLLDAVNAYVIQNTISNNDSTATVASLIDPGTQTTPAQIAGLSVEPNTVELDTFIADTSTQKGFSNATITHNILRRNRSFHYEVVSGLATIVPVLDPTALGQCRATGAVYNDMGVLGGAYTLTAYYSVFDSTTLPVGGIGNRAQTPGFIAEYCNHSDEINKTNPDPIRVIGSAGEGGNFLDVHYGPLQDMNAIGAAWDYHLLGSSALVDYRPGSGLNGAYDLQLVRHQAPAYSGVLDDIDFQIRTIKPDIGADEFGGINPPVGVCSSQSTFAGQACLVNSNCLPKIVGTIGPAVCVF